MKNSSLRSLLEFCNKYLKESLLWSGCGERSFVLGVMFLAFLNRKLSITCEMSCSLSSSSSWWLFWLGTDLFVWERNFLSLLLFGPLCWMSYLEDWVWTREDVFFFVLMVNGCCRNGNERCLWGEWVFQSNPFEDSGDQENVEGEDFLWVMYFRWLEVLGEGGLWLIGSESESLSTTGEWMSWLNCCSFSGITLFCKYSENEEVLWTFERGICFVLDPDRWTRVFPRIELLASAWWNMVGSLYGCESWRIAIPWWIFLLVVNKGEEKELTLEPIHKDEEQQMKHVSWNVFLCVF